MAEETTGSGLTVIEGGKATTRHRTGNKAEPGGLTVKQERFAQLLADGLTNTEAYRQAYDAANMSITTIYSESAKLAAHPKVSARVNVLAGIKAKRNSMAAEKRDERVWRNVWRLAEGENVPPSVQQAALALAAKMAGMLTDRLEVKQENADSKSLEAEIIERLQRLTA